MWSFLGCFLFGAMVATGTCLECEYCNAVGATCTGYMKTCSDDEDTCIVILKEVFQPPAVIKLISKDCGKSAVYSDGVADFSIGNGVQTRVWVKCCTGDACKPATPPALPPPDNKPNGLQCPGCAGLFSADCYANPVACTGLENKCIDFAGSVTGGVTIDVALKGCAHEAICKIVHEGHNVFSGFDVNITKAGCYPASNTIPEAP